MNSDIAATGVLPASRAPVSVRIAGAIDLVVECIAATLLLSTIAIALLQVFCRYVLNDSLSWPEEMAKFAFVWFVFLGAAMVTRRSRHIVIDLVPRSLGPEMLRIHAVAVRLISASVAAFLLIYGADLVSKSTFTSPALQWPYTYLYLAIPVSAAISLVVLALEPIAGIRGAFVPLLVAAAGVALYLALESAAGTTLIGSNFTHTHTHKCGHTTHTHIICGYYEHES
jgi:C4-dicarboxylate transporter DctM subunit